MLIEFKNFYFRAIRYLARKRSTRLFISNEKAILSATARELGDRSAASYQLKCSRIYFWKRYSGAGRTHQEENTVE